MLWLYVFCYQSNKAVRLMAWHAVMGKNKTQHPIMHLLPSNQYEYLYIYIPAANVQVAVSAYSAVPQVYREALAHQQGVQLQAHQYNCIYSVD